MPAPLNPPLGSPPRRLRAWCAACLALGPGLAAQEAFDVGPIAFREVFPLYQIALSYQPVDPEALGPGRWRASLEHLQANTFEFSDVFKEQTPRDAQGRVKVTRDFVLAHAAEYAHLPVVFFFDEETARSTLRLRRGIGADTDLWLEAAFQSHGGGYLDGLIESFHQLGFEQYGRDKVEKDRLTLVVMEKGQLRFFSDSYVRGKTEDPVVGLMHRFLSTPAWTVSAAVSLKPPLTTTYGVFKEGWDHSVSVTAKWKPGPRNLFYFGAGLVRRPHGNEAMRSFLTGEFRDGAGAHATWEHRGLGRFRPYLQLLYQTGYLRPQESQKLDRGSLQHDLGFHWVLGPRSLLSFRYLNNITHNENTADMGLGLAYTRSF